MSAFVRVPAREAAVGLRFRLSTKSSTALKIACHVSVMFIEPRKEVSRTAECARGQLKKTEASD